MVNMVQMQLGKKGLTLEFIENIKINFKNVENIRISVLKSACRDRDELKEIKDKILSDLGNNYTGKTLGFTIILKKWRKPRNDRTQK